MVGRILEYLALGLCILLVLPVHEFAHAFAAVKCGDDTPRFSGRYTLNPLKHFDILGLIMMVLVRFGWAKPVPINPNNFRNYKTGMFWVSVSGVIANYLMAFIAYPILQLVLKLPDMLLFDDFIIYFFLFAYSINISLFLFNLLPIYPLDGFRVVEAASKTRNAYMRFMYRYGSYILLGLIAINILASYVPVVGYINVLGYYMQYGTWLISKPITLFWGLFF